MAVVAWGRASAVAPERQPVRSANKIDKAYYVFANGRQLGPFEFDRVVTMARGGELGRADLVWTRGLEQWTPASSVPGLFPPSLFKPDQRSPVQPAPRAPAARTSKRKPYVIRHWRGRASLTQATFVNCILAWTAYIGLSYLLLSAIITTAGAQARTLWLVDLALYAVGMALYVWSIVGAWRSARRHAVKTGERMWPAMAQAYIVYTVALQAMLYGSIATLFVASRLIR